jgi:UDP:flavonoid glycosyltransferase YjiC (YdhE family)
MKILTSLLLKILLLLTINDEFIKSEKTIKNILVFSFPGGKSHNFIFTELFAHTQKRLKQDNQNSEYKFHLIVHNYDLNIWKGSPHNIIGFGDKQQYEEKFQKALDMAREDPVLGYNNFNNAMIHLYNDFLNDKTHEKLKGIKYDLLISDVANYIAPFLRTLFNIEKSIYVNPTCVYPWLNDAFEYNASYHPVIGTPFTELMTFSERFINQLFLYGTRLSYSYFKMTQYAVFTEHGYNMKLNPFQTNFLFLNQCVDGVHYSYSLPPNMINTGAILPKPAIPIQDEVINDFLNKFEKNIYVSQGTITKVLDIDILFQVFRTFPKIGFILSIKKELLTNYREAPRNVLLLEWVPQNDLLGDPKINLFITHGGLNSILESLYHAKPMIVIGTSIDQVNGAVVVDYRKYGKGITKNSEITKENLIAYIQEVMGNPIYKKNCLFAQKLVHEKDGKETFYYWLNYTIEYGYEHLLVPAYTEYSFIELYNIDVILVIASLIYILYLIIIFLIKKLFKKILERKQATTKEKVQ